MHDAATIATFKNACCTDSSRQLSAEMLTDNVAMQIIFRRNAFRIRRRQGSDFGAGPELTPPIGALSGVEGPAVLRRDDQAQLPVVLS
jgi:hypothetical protein